MAQPVLLDNTVLTNFAFVERPDLVFTLWSQVSSTPEVLAEYAAGVHVRNLPARIWQGLQRAEMTPAERTFAQGLRRRLGAGERPCIAVAFFRKGLLGSDDGDARREAQAIGVPTTGTLGILLLNIREERLALEEGNRLLTQLVQWGFRSPVEKLDDLV